MLTLDSVTFAYPGRAHALHGVTLRLPAGITLLVGPNAGGKTTLLRLLAGLLEKDGGEILSPETGHSVTPVDLRKRARMVMQDADPQILGSSVREDIELGRAASNCGDRFTEMVDRLTRKFSLHDLLDEPVETLSYGQKRKLCLVHALLAGPEILLLDEPFAGLDYPAALELREFIRDNARDGLTQVISTHELEPVFGLADHLVVVAGGTVAAAGTPASLENELGRWSVRSPGRGWDRE